MKNEKLGGTGGRFSLMLMFCYCVRDGSFCCFNQFKMCFRKCTGKRTVMDLFCTAQKCLKDLAGLACLLRVRASVTTIQNVVND